MTSPAAHNAGEFTAGRLTIDHVTELVRFWQAGHHPLEVDGMAGPATVRTVESAIAAARGAAPIAPFLLSPLPTISGGRRPVITSSYRPPDRANHDGCDWFYPWRPGDLPDFAGDGGCEGRNPDGSPRWVVPFGTFALAAADGTVSTAGNSSTGFHVWVDHGNGLRSGYFHLLDARVKVGDHVRSGAALGLVGHNPSASDGRHLHFEVSPVDRYAPMDPETYLLPSARG